MTLTLNASNTLPNDGLAGTLVGRAWVPGTVAGPGVVVLRESGVFDISETAPTMSDLCAMDDPVAVVRGAEGQRVGDVEDILSNTYYANAQPDIPHFLAPLDLQAVKACGVTFVSSMLERVIEEQAGGDSSKAEQVRAEIHRDVGTGLADVKPGSAEAEKLKAALIERGIWSQYLEVGIGPYAEVFTKSQPMSSVGTGAQIGLHPESTWTNPEPEMVVVVSPQGKVVAATLGNDVNLRDFEGRSALLLGKTKDNNASCAIGPFIRLFDDTFGIDDVRRCQISLTVEGEDDFVLQGGSSMAEISRDVLDLVAQTINENHQYPDGLVLFTGTLFAPVEDRDAPGMGFTHKMNDVVRIAAPELGTLSNFVTTCDKAPPWTFGTRELFRNLTARSLLR